MIQIIGLLLCVYLGFKGIEIYQIAISSNKEDKRWPMTVGVVALIAAIAIAGVFALLFLIQGASIPNFPR